MLKKLNFTINEVNLEKDATIVLQTLFPDISSNIRFKKETDGITNVLLNCTLDNDLRVLVRIYGKGSEVFIDRSQEIKNLQRLSQCGLAPSVYGSFENGIVYGYVEGRMTDLNDFSDEHISLLIARKLKKVHDVDFPEMERFVPLFDSMRKWLLEVPPSFNQHIDLNVLKSELDFLEVSLGSKQDPIVFCHNDLLHGNVIVSPSKDDVSFIDFEYGSFNPRDFDIANHFNEFAGFECQYERYPQKEFQLRWLKEYLQTECSVEALEVYENVQQWSLASLMMWLVWALLQGHLSLIDFDFVQFAKLRFQEYLKRKKEIFNK